jgi:hypothetical protein
MRDWRERSGGTRVPPAGRGNSGADWGAGGGRPQGGSNANWGGNGSGGNRPQGGSNANWPPRGNSGANWGRDADDGGAARGSGRYRAGPEDYRGVDQARALVPSAAIMPNEIAVGMPGMAGVPGLPTEEEERLLGIRRPVYIPVTGEKRKGKISRFRVVSGVLSVVLMCAVSASLIGIFGQKYIKSVTEVTGIQRTPTTLNYAQVPATPVATAGPANKYVTSVVTAKHIDGSQNAKDVTSHFLVNDQVFVVVQIRNAPKGPHTVCAEWFINASQGMQAIHPPGEWADKQGCDTINSAGVNAAFALVYPQSGIGMARIFWDRPASDTNPPATDPAIAATIIFAVLEPATPTPIAPTVTPTIKPGTTPSPKGDSSGLPDVVWIGRPNGA